MSQPLFMTFEEEKKNDVWILCEQTNHLVFDYKHNPPQLPSSARSIPQRRSTKSGGKDVLKYHNLLFLCSMSLGASSDVLPKFEKKKEKITRIYTYI